jgi:hypothetical protein
MQKDVQDGNDFDDFMDELEEESRNMTKNLDFHPEGTTGYGLEQERTDVEDPFATEAPNAFLTFLDGPGYVDAPQSMPYDNYIANALSARCKDSFEMSQPIGDQSLAYFEDTDLGMEDLGGAPFRHIEGGPSVWESGESTKSEFIEPSRTLPGETDIAIASNTPERLSKADASVLSNENLQAATKQMSGDNDGRPSDLTSRHVMQYLRTVRTDAQHQPAITLFRDNDAAKVWRERRQSQPIFNIQDTAYPRTPAEEREYVRLLKNAFKYMGTGTKCNSSEQIFMTRTLSNDGEKEIESWMWQLLKEITNRQSYGRPSNLVRRKSGLDPANQTFAERFSTVFNALRFEKRCCHRFSSISNWHKRLANDAMSEVEEYRKNDKTNWKRAKEKKLRDALTAAPAQANETPRKRSREDPQSELTAESPFDSDFSLGKSAPKGVSSFAKSKAGRKKPSNFSSSAYLTTTSEDSSSQQPFQDMTFSQSHPGRASKRTSLISEAFTSSPMKRLKLDDGSADIPRGPIGSSAVDDADLLGSTSVTTSHQSPSGTSFQHQFGFGSGAGVGTSPYGTSATPNATTMILSGAGQRDAERLGLQPTPEPCAAEDPYASTEKAYIPSAQELKIDAGVRAIGFTEGQKARAKQARMSTCDYVNFARVMNGADPVDWPAVRARVAAKRRQVVPS